MNLPLQSPFAKLPPPKKPSETPFREGEEVEDKQVDKVQGCAVFLQPGTTRSPGSAREPGTIQDCLCRKVVMRFVGREYLRIFIARHLLFPRVCANISWV